MKYLFLGILLIATTLLIHGCQNKTAENQNVDSGISENVSAHADIAKKYHIVSNASVVHWEGYRPAMGYAHNGIVTVSDGSISVTSNGQIATGSVIVDMRTITVEDLEGQKKENLEAHLKGTSAGKEDDFFNVTRFPTARFEIIKTAQLKGDTEANTMVYGNLTMRNVTNPVAFKANVTISNNTLTAISGVFKIDRTKWNIKILSKAFFENLKERFIDDEIGLRIEIHAEAGKEM